MVIFYTENGNQTFKHGHRFFDMLWSEKVTKLQAVIWPLNALMIFLSRKNYLRYKTASGNQAFKRANDIPVQEELFALQNRKR